MSTTTALDSAGSMVNVPLTVTPDKDGLKNVMRGPCRLYSLVAHNTSATTAAYLLVYDDVNPTFGTDEPNYIFALPAASVTPLVFELPAGVRLKNGLSLACAQEVALSNDPESDVDVQVVATRIHRTW